MYDALFRMIKFNLKAILRPGACEVQRNYWPSSQNRVKAMAFLEEFTFMILRDVYGAVFDTNLIF